MQTSLELQSLQTPLTTDEVGSIPENAPIVSIDVSLGKKYEDVSFDYEAFSQEAERLGFPVEAINELQIRIADDGGSNYSQDTKSIQIGLNDRANKVLSHELQHASDDANGILISDIRHKIGAKSRVPAAYIGPVTIANTISESIAGVTGHEKVEYGNIGLAFVIGAVAVANLYGYWGHPMERKARKAGRNSQESIIQMTKR